MSYQQRGLRPAEAIYQPLPEESVERLPPVRVWLAEGERPLRDVEDTLKYHLRLRLMRGTYEAWVRDLRLVAVGEDEVTIRAANRQAQEWLELRLRKMLGDVLRGIVGREVAVRIEGP